MRLAVTRSGGFAGLTEQVAAVDTATLGPAAAQSIEQLVREIGFFDLPPSLPSEPAADLFCYQISVTDGPRLHAVRFFDTDAPETAPLRRLLELVYNQ